MDGNFNHFLHSVLIEAAGRQKGPVIKPVLLKDICIAVRPDVPPTWVEMVADRIRALKLGELIRDSEKPGLFWLELNGSGLARVHEAKAERRKPTVGQRFRSVPWGKGTWDVIKIGLGVVLGALGTKYFGK